GGGSGPFRANRGLMGLVGQTWFLPGPVVPLSSPPASPAPPRTGILDSPAAARANNRPAAGDRPPPGGASPHDPNTEPDLLHAAGPVPPPLTGEGDGGVAVVPEEIPPALFDGSGPGGGPTRTGPWVGVLFAAGLLQSPAGQGGSPFHPRRRNGKGGAGKGEGPGLAPLDQDRPG